MDSDSTSYNHNLTYRSQIPLIQEEHKELQNYPLRNEDPDVESISYISRDNTQTMKESITMSMNRDTISGTIYEMKKLYTIKSEIKRQNTMNTPFKRQNFHSPLTRGFSNNMEISISNTIYNQDELEQKVKPVRLMKAMKLLVNVQHFYRQLTNNTRIVNKLSFQQHRQIGDIVSIHNNKFFDPMRYSQMLCNFFYEIILKMQFSGFHIFDPSSVLIKTWDSILSALILYSTFLLNLELFFTMSITEFKILFQILFILCLLDIFIEINTGIVEKGTVNYDRQTIFKYYVKKILIFDLLGNFPLITKILSIQISMKMQFAINILFIFKWIKIKKIFSWLSFYLSYEKNKKNMLDLIRLLFFIIGVCHIFCLFWHGLALYEISMGRDNTWINSKNLIDSSILDRYAYSFYFLAVTMITVGYGDITPQNTTEILFTILTMFVTGIVYAFSLNTIGSIIDNIEKKDKKYKESMQIIHGLMRDENVSRDLRIKVSNYIEYLYKVIKKINLYYSNFPLNQLQSNYLNLRNKKLIS